MSLSSVQQSSKDMWIDTQSTDKDAHGLVVGIVGRVSDRLLLLSSVVCSSSVQLSLVMYWTKGRSLPSEDMSGLDSSDIGVDKDDRGLILFIVLLTLANVFLTSGGTNE